MSATPPEGTPPPPRPEGTIRCARCGADVPPDHDWCLECGLAARTRIAPTPRWRIPLLAAAIVSVLALAALAVAFVDLTEDPKTVGPATTATQAPAPAQTQPPAETQPPATEPGLGTAEPEVEPPPESQSGGEQVPTP